MKVRTQQNFNRKTYETVFGISIMPDGGRRYCKYPIGHQEYKDYTQAYQAMKDVQKILDNGGRLVYLCLWQLIRKDFLPRMHDFVPVN